MNLTTIKAMIAGAALMLVSPTGFAQDDLGDDTSADVDAGFFAKLDQSKGVVLRVPINAAGEENATKAELRIDEGQFDEDRPQDLETVWRHGESVSTQPQITDEDIERDSSTWGWHRYRYNSWVRPYYYYSYYRPSFYYGGYYRTTYYTYTPSYYACNGYRYYYYTW